MIDVEEGDAISNEELKSAVAEAFGKAEFGLVVEDFLASPIGRYLCLRAEAERNEALEALATISPERPALIAEQQQKIRVCDSWQHWLTDAITEGRMAHQQLVASGN